MLVATEHILRAALGGLETGYPVSGFRWVWVALAPLPWLIGGILLLAGRAYLGTAVVATTAAVSLPSGLLAVAALRDGWPPGGAATDLVPVLGQPAVLVLGLLAAGASLLAGPREGWRTAAPGPIGVYVTVAVLAWLPTALQTLELSPPGAMRSFARTELSRLEGLPAVTSVSYAVVVAALLFAAPRLRPEVAGAMLLVYAVPQLADAVGDLVQVRVTEHLIVTPPAILGDVGLVGLLVVGGWWITTAGRRHEAVTGDVAPSPRTDEPR